MTGLPTVEWGGLELNLVGTGAEERVVTSVDGWYGTPDSETHDVPRTLTDGALYGPRVIEPRVVVIHGWVFGPRQSVIDTRNELAARAWSAQPSSLRIGDPWIGTDLSALVRADPGLTHTWHGHQAFDYQVSVIAADPRRYSTNWSTETIRLASGEDTGRRYPRIYPWQYASAEVAGSARLTNPGGLPAPVQALYEGPLSESYLTSRSGGILHIAALATGEQLLVDTQTLAASAPGGATRAAYVLAGTSPMLIPARSTVIWSLRATGTGSVTLNWRGTYA